MENNLKAARTGKNLTQSELAGLAGVTRQTIGLIEAGKYNPTLKLCLILGLILERSLEELFSIREDN
ncbi:MAG: helix-turn-helix transcriptional regulator [Candidatus Fermentibacteria bacterium]